MKTASILTAGLLGCALLGGCSSSSADDPGEDTEATASRRALLASQVDRVIVPAFERLAVSSAALDTAAAAYAAAAMGGGDASAELSAARAAFDAMMVDLQAAELLQVGPYGSPDEFAGGLDIHDEMYSWPTVGPCRVDQETVEDEFAQAEFFARNLSNVYGADALERLLFAEGTDNACTASHPINMNGSWAALDASAIRANRARYAAVVAGRLAQDAARVRDAWTGGFAAGMRAPGEAGSAYRTTQQAVDELFASMFYIEREVKDTKLGTPLGITAGCASTTCPDLLESQFAGRSLEWVRANIASFEALFFGGDREDAEARGFDDLLRDSGGAELADRMSAALAAVRMAESQMSTPLRDHLDSQAAMALHEALRVFAQDFKTQFVSVLALRVPSEGAADND